MPTATDSVPETLEAVSAGEPLPAGDGGWTDDGFGETDVVAVTGGDLVPQWLGAAG